ncbi:uncharacterized protein FFE2_16062 [Fusarium fujikuroi]|nr:uncharacterized protein FFE2_16062 [Fusarium fujikuroi]
MLAFNAIYS